jgi:hypothetical protein
MRGTGDANGCTGRIGSMRTEGLSHGIVNRQVRVICPVWLRAIDGKPGMGNP